MIVGIDVTEAHIDLGVPFDCMCCPIALAVADRVKPECGVVVGASIESGCVIRIGDTVREVVPEYNNMLVEFIINFDLTRYGMTYMFNPFSFKMDIDPESLRQ